MGSSDVPHVPMDPNLGGVQAQAFGNIEGLGAYTPQIQQMFYDQRNNANTWGKQAVQGAQAAGQQGVQQGYQNIGLGNQFSAIPAELMPYIQSTLNTAYDPQKQLYNQQSQLSADQTNADLASRGLAYSPWATGVSSQAAQNFNTNWQQTQLQRQLTGAQTAGGLESTAGAAADTGAGLGALGTKQIAEGYSLPYVTQTGINRDLSSFTPFLTSNQNQMVQDYINYYGAANQNTSNAVTAGHYQDQSSQALGQGIGSALGWTFGGSGGQGGFGSSIGGLGLAALMV